MQRELDLVAYSCHRTNSHEHHPWCCTKIICVPWGFLDEAESWLTVRGPHYFALSPQDYWKQSQPRVLAC